MDPHPLPTAGDTAEALAHPAFQGLCLTLDAATAPSKQ